MTIVHRDVRIGVSGLLAVALAAATHAIANAEDGDFAGFEPPVLYDLPSPARSIRAGDLDGDGDVDLVMTHLTGNSVSILFNNGDGTFEPGPNMLVAIGMGDSAITDFDGDGIMDIIAVSQGPPVNRPFDGIGRVAILRGLGGGDFAEPEFFFAGMQPVGVAAGDLNGDGHSDFAVTNQLSGDVAVFLNNGDGTPNEPNFYSVGAFPGNVSSSDMDLDGDLDLVIANRFSDSVSLLLNNGIGLFPQHIETNSTFIPNSRLAVDDFNGDGFPDVLIATGSLQAVRLHIGARNGLHSSELLDVGIANSAVTVSKIDPGRKPDIVVSGRNPPSEGNPLARVALADGHGGLSRLLSPILLSESSDLVLDSVSSKFDRDSKIDCAVIIGARVAILINSTQRARSGDLSGDGSVNGNDLAILLRQWGGGGSADFDNSGSVDGRDLAHLLANWTKPGHGASATLKGQDE